MIKEDCKKIRGVIFDLDGTLIEADEAIYLGLQEAFRSFQRPIFSFQDLRQHLRADLESTLAPFFSGQELLQAISVMRKRYEEVYLDKTRFLDGAKEVIETLYQEGISLAVASNKFGRFSRGALAHLGVEGYFTAVFGAGDGLRNKPYPDMIQASLGAMALPAEAVVFVGDSIEDIKAGKRAGVDVYALPTGVYSKQELSQGSPKGVLRHLRDVPVLVKNSGSFLAERTSPLPSLPGKIQPS
jgi:HAD superfamily hydrolase (TIGR01509 family)